MSNRNQLIQLVHVGKRELTLEDDTYRLLLQAETGKSSCSKMDIRELEKVLGAMEGKGFKRIFKGKKTKRRMSPKSGKAKYREMDMVRAIWITMSKQGFVRDGSESALDNYVRRTTNQADNKGVDHIGWCDADQIYKVLGSLKSWHRRVMIDAMKDKRWKVPMNKTGFAPAGYDAIANEYEAMLTNNIGGKNE